MPRCEGQKDLGPVARGEGVGGRAIGRKTREKARHTAQNNVSVHNTSDLEG